MGFLDNSGNIILDAVLTDTGRMRLAKGDGSFKIAKFALGDDEIVYNQYNSNHPSGSAYYDLDILQTPILEAFTNNMSSMKSKLISIPRTNLLYLPIMKINELITKSNAMHSIGSFVVCTDKTTENSFMGIDGVIYGFSIDGSIIRVDQGLDTIEIPPSFGLDADLVETQYIVEIDNRFGRIVSSNKVAASPSYIDDDQIASYFLSLGTDTDFIYENPSTESDTSTQVIAGPRGTYFQFRIQTSVELNQSTYLFERLGTTGTLNSISVHYIDSYVRVQGATTGYRIDIPVRYIKKQ